MHIDYEYKNIPIKGGGFVTGFVFSSHFKDILYARTDIGGVYRFDFEKNEWISLIDDVKGINAERCFPIGIAVDENVRERLYIACGDHRSGSLYISPDLGKTYIKKSIPCGIHGNFLGRSAGERLIKKDGVLYFASQTEGLFVSSNEGDSWENIKPKGEKNLTFIYKERLSGKEFFIVGTTGEQNANGNTRGHTLYASYDNLKTFEELEIPQPIMDPVCSIFGFVPQRAAVNDEYLFVTFAQIRNGFGGFNAISCDSGMCYDGRLYRYKLDGGRLTLDKDVTPECIPFKNFRNSVSKEFEGNVSLGAGLSGINFCDGMLVVSEIASDRADDAIYLSEDNGDHFKVILKGLEVGKMNFTVSYMKPEYNGNRSLIHWMSDVKINPFDSNMLLFNTGTGVFATRNLTAAKTGGVVEFAPLCDGIEETVHMNVYSPPNGEVKCIDLVGDLGGFVFSDLENGAENTFANENGDRYITCLNADFSDKGGIYFAATPRGNWTGRTKGGVIVTKDQGKSFKLLKYPLGITDKLDELIENIKRPNVDSGWVAMTSDENRLIWAVSGIHRRFLSDTVVYTDDEGESWHLSGFFGKRDYKAEPISIKIYSCRVDENFIWAINDKGVVFISEDKGESFYERELSGDTFCEPQERFGDNRFEARAEPCNPHVLWIALHHSGLFRLEFKNGVVYSQKITAKDDRISGIGFGKAKGEDYPITIFTTGIIGGEYGFWRSTDYAESFERINNDNQCYGHVSGITGDPREFGRVYIASGSKGILTGVPKETK
ncbi:MAG: hypothetical protein LUH57_02325 [Ruminococcus sp.]|nr:hypothetical protein [Ruminococcus sp.]